MKKFIYTLLLILITGTSGFALSDEQIINGNELFGNDVAIYGDWAVVGIRDADISLMGTVYPSLGMVSIYKKSVTGVWEHQQNIQEGDYTYAVAGSQMGMHYGHSVDIYEDYIIVGAPSFDSDMLGSTGPDGMAFIYQLNTNNGLWEKVAELKPEVDVHNQAGISVSISQNWAVIGDNYERHSIAGSNGEDAAFVGCASVYHKEGSSWVFHTKLKASDGWGIVPEGLNDLYGDHFGNAVDVYGDMIAVGAVQQGQESGGLHGYTGKVYIYEWDGASWNETEIISPSPEIRSNFGYSVQLYNGQLVVGAPGSDIAGVAGTDQGAVYYYNNYSGNWTAGHKFAASNAQNGAEFGHDLALYNNTIAVGCPSYNDPIENEGRVYTYDIADAFSETDNFMGSNTILGDGFGECVALSNADLMVGVPFTEHDASNGALMKDGSVYMYSRLTAFGGSWEGTISIDWNDALNWADNAVPNAITDVNIPAAAPFMPTIANGNAECRSMTIEAGATFTNGNSGQLHINGNLVCHGDIINTQSYYLKVEGTSLFDGAGVQHMPAGVFHELTFDAGANSNLQGDIEIIGTYKHNTSKDLNVLDNIFTIHGNIYGTNKWYLKFNETSSLYITGQLRSVSFEIPNTIQDLYNVTVNMQGGHEVWVTGNVEIHNTLSLIKGDLVVGHSMMSSLNLNRPIYILDGDLVVNSDIGGFQTVYVNDYNIVYGDFIIPQGLEDINYLYIFYKGICKQMGDINIKQGLYLASSTVITNGFDLSLDADVELGLSGNAVLENIILNTGAITSLKVWEGLPTIKMSGQIGSILTHANSQGLVFAAASHIEVTGNTTVNHPITLASDNTGSATFIDNGISYAAKNDEAIFKVEQYISSKEKWHYISTPVKNSTANFFSGAYLNYYDTDLSDWVAFTSLDQAVNTLQGYSTKLPNTFSGQTLTFSGELNTAKDNPISINLSNGGSQYNLVGNPFPSTIDWDNANWTKTNLANAIYIWNPATGSYTSYVNGVGVNSGTRYIAANQGFFVQATGASPSLQIDNNDVRVSQAQNFFKDEEEKEMIEQLSVSLLNENGQDEIIIRFDEDATEDFDAEFDANKMFGNNSLAQIYASDNVGNKMSIHSLKSIKETDFVQLGLQISESGIYTFAFDNKNSFSEFVTVKIEDTKEETITEIAAQDTYIFDYEKGENAKRFILHFKDVTAVNDLENHIQFAYYSHGSIYISNNETSKFNNVQLINMAGQVITTETLTNETLHRMNVSDVKTGMYILQLISNSKTSTQKIIIK